MQVVEDFFGTYELQWATSVSEQVTSATWYRRLLHCSHQL